MEKHNWFSSKVRLICFIEGLGATEYLDSVFLFLDQDFETAFQKALELGKSLENSYHNGDQKKVSWKLKEIISLDMINKESLDGVEVYSEPIEINLDENIVEMTLHPENSMPTQTL